MVWLSEVPDSTHATSTSMLGARQKNFTAPSHAVHVPDNPSVFGTIVGPLRDAAEGHFPLALGGAASTEESSAALRNVTLGRVSNLVRDLWNGKWRGERASIKRWCFGSTTWRWASYIAGGYEAGTSSSPDPQWMPCLSSSHRSPTSRSSAASSDARAAQATRSAARGFVFIC